MKPLHMARRLRSPRFSGALGMVATMLGLALGALLLPACKHAPTDQTITKYACKLLPQADGGVTLSCLK